MFFTLLQPFEEVTKVISSSEANVSEIISIVPTLKRYLDKNGSKFFGDGTMKDDLKNNLTTSFSEILRNDFFCLSNITGSTF